MERWSIGLLVLVLVLCVSVPAYSGRNPPAAPFEYLQKQIDELAGQLGIIEDRFTPPTISYALSCHWPDVNLGLTVTDDKEIAYHVIQKQGGDPARPIITFVEPGLTIASYSITVGAGPEETDYLLVAADTNGNVAKDMVHIDDDTCRTPCGPGQVCPP
jgi:hypothetical protein